MRGALLALAACSSSPPAPPHNAGGGAGTLTFRRLSTGAITTKSTLATYTLVRSGDRATLDIVKAETPSGEMMGVSAGSAWREAARESYAGPMRALAGGAVELDLHKGGEAMRLVCKPTRLAVAPATAVRTRSPDTSECGDTGTWRPATTTMIDVFACRPAPQPSDEPPPPPPTDPTEAKFEAEQRVRAERAETLAFAAAPGLEYLYVNDDCVIQGGDLRLVAPGGAIANVRPAKP